MMPRLRCQHFALAALLAFSPATALAQSPSNWFAFVYSDLQTIQLQQLAFKAIWDDRMKANNAYYKAKNDPRFLYGNAPITEAHFFVESKAQSRVLVLSVVNSAEACKAIAQDPLSKTTLKMCPTRIAMQDHDARSVKDAGQACFVEYGSASNTTPADMDRNAMYATYDRATNAMKLDARFQGALQDQCAISIPLPAWPRP